MATTKFWVLLDGSLPSDMGRMSCGTSPEGFFVRVLGHVPAHVRGMGRAVVAARFIRASTAAAGFYYCGNCGNATVAVSGGRVIVLGDDPIALDDVLDSIEDGGAILTPLPQGRNSVPAWCPAEATRWLGGLISLEEEDADWGIYTLKVRR